MIETIRVVYLIDSLRYGGAEVLLFDLTSRLDSYGISPIVFYCEEGPLIEDFKNRKIPIVHLSWFARVDPLLLIKMVKEIRKVHPQIVHTHLFKSDFHGRLAARIAGVPIVITTLHNNNAWAQNSLFGWLYGLTAQLADKLIAVADEVKDYATCYLRIPSKKLIVIPNAVSFERFQGNHEKGLDIRTEFNISKNAPLFGIIGRLEPQKNHENFLQAVQLIHQKNQDARFLIVGDGILRNHLIELTENLKLQDVVTFCGLRKDIPAVLAALDVVVISSHYEGLPVVLLEAMAAGCPVISTAVSGVLSVLEDGKTGLLVEPSNSEALANACLRLIDDPKLRQKITQGGSERVRTFYNIATMTEKTVALYRSLLAARGVLV